MIKAYVRQIRARYREITGRAAKLRPDRHSRTLVRLGSGYGAWTVADDPGLYGSTIWSAGLGEDASFDIAFAERYNARVVMIDPTPRAIAFYAREVPQDGRFELCDRALWTEDSRISFFAPPNPAHVSHSIVNFQNDYSSTTEHIEVEAITVDYLIDRYGCPPLVKLDIEGAEVEVICDMMRKEVHPSQILVEFDELQVPSQQSRKRVERVHAALLASGYSLVHHDSPANFLYVRRKGLSH
jgi:FkbM family methyltransferase